MANGRNEDGTFASGHTLSRGEHKTSVRKFNEELRKAFFDDGGEPGERFFAVRDRLLAIALNDERKDQLKAIEIILNYLLGKPRQSIELEGDDRLLKLYDVAMSAAMEKV